MCPAGSTTTTYRRYGNIVTVVSPPATTAFEQEEVHHAKKTAAEVVAQHSNDSRGGVPPQRTAAMPAVDTSDRDTTCGATTPPTADAVAADNSAAILPMSDAADDTKDGATSEEERDIQDGCQSSAERNIWSVFNPIWNIFVVNKARLPSRRDRGADWAGTAGRPEELHTFLGTKNPVNRKTMGFLRRCIEEKFVTDGILLRGPAGSGKSALIKAFLSGFLERFASNPEAFARLYRTRVLDVTKDLEGTQKKLAFRVKRFFAAKKDRLSDIVPRFVVVDGIERVPSKAQTSLLALIEGAASGGFSSQGGTGDSGGGGDSGAEGAGGGSSAGVRMMLTTRDASKLTAALRKCVKPYKVELVDEVDGVKIFLSILQRENVGYELLAVKAIFRMHWPDLQRCIAVANEVFCEKQFLSEENTLKVIAPRTLAAREERSHHVQASDALEPLDPCHACTLRPPCQHISEQELASRGIRRRAELPQRRSSDGKPGAGGDAEGFVDCQGFVKRGACRAFNERGRCSNHHPLNAHVVEVPRPRCPQCTIRLPCGHCNYDHSRRGLETFCEVAGARIEKRIARLHRLLKAGAAAVERAVAAKASFEAGDGNPPRGWAQGTTDVRSPPPSSQRPESRLTPVPGAVSTNKSPKQLKPSTFGSRANKANSRGVEAVIAKLGKIGADLEAERAWAVDDREPGGGMHEFRASVFDKKMERLSRRCEDAHEEADAVSEAYILLAERVR